VSHRGYVVDMVYPGEGGVVDDSPRSTSVTSTGQAGRTQAVTDQVKNISTRLANRVAEVRTRTTDADPKLTESTHSTASTQAAFTSTAAAVTGKVGQARANLAGRATQFTTRTRQDPLSALPAVGAVLAGVVVVWLAGHVITRPNPVLNADD